jgi:hypothetical protein
MGNQLLLVPKQSGAHIMKTIKVPVTDSQYQLLVTQRKAAGLPSVSALLLKNSNILSDEDEAREIVNVAFRRACTKSSGEQFTLRELFQSDLWEKFGKSARLRAGRQFFGLVSAATHGIRTLPKTSSNHQRYEKA